MILGAALGLAKSIGARATGGLVRRLASGQDQERFNRNMDAYNRARTGDAAALLFLKYRTGQHGTGIAPGYERGAPIGGWATLNAQEDARDLYANLTSGLTAPVRATPNVAVLSPTNQLFATLGRQIEDAGNTAINTSRQGAAEAILKAGAGASAAVAPPGSFLANPAQGTLWIVGGVLLLAFIVLRRK